MQAFQKYPNIQKKKNPFENNFSGALVYMGGAAGNWTMHFISSAYFDKIIIFGLSKDQTFRIRSTFMNPGQFLILVTHLFRF
jgi:hypothetical protein